MAECLEWLAGIRFWRGDDRSAVGVRRMAVSDLQRRRSCESSEELPSSANGRHGRLDRYLLDRKRRLSRSAWTFGRRIIKERSRRGAYSHDQSDSGEADRGNDIGIRLQRCEQQRVDLPSGLLRDGNGRPLLQKTC